MANSGKHVKAHYIGTLDDGTKFDSSYDRGEPIEFVCMAGQMIPGFDAAVNEMAVGETRTVHIPCEQAYGPRNPEAIQKVPASMVPAGMQLEVGQTIYLSTPYGPMPAKVAAMDDESVTLDMNHEMAGKDLNFEITLVEVSEHCEHHQHGEHGHHADGSECSCGHHHDE